MKRITIVLFLLAFTASAHESFGQKPKPSPTPIKNTIADGEPGVDPDAQLTPFDIRSDGLGIYQGGSESVVSGVGNGWELSLLSSTTRTARFSFGDPVLWTIPSGRTPPSDGNYRTRFLSQCFTGNLVDLPANGTMNCNLIVAIDVGADRYSLRFYAANYSCTNDVSWTCTAAGADGKCNTWRVQSANDNKLIAQLLKVTTQRNKIVTEDYGQYKFSFDITVKR